MKLAKKTPVEVADLIRVPDVVPKNAIVITYSEMDTFRQCPLKHKWSYRDRWVKPAKDGSALSRGSLWHEVMEVHYTWLQRFGDRRKADPAGLLADIREFVHVHLLYDEQAKQTEDQVLVEWMYDGYVERYGTDPNWEILAIESAGQVRLPVPGKPKARGRYWLRFKIDMVIRDRTTGQVWIVDHKSAKDFTRQTEIDIDDQFGLYTFALRMLGIQSFGFIRSDARTQRNKGPMELDNRFRRLPTFRSDVELRAIAEDVYHTAVAAWGGNQQGRVWYSSPAPDRCSWRCDFRETHLAVRKGIAEKHALPDFGFEVNERKHREYGENPVLLAIPQV